MTTFEILKEQDNLIMQGDVVAITPTSQWTWINGGEKLITPDTYIGLKMHLFQFTPDLTEYEPFDKQAFTSWLRARWGANRERAILEQEQEQEI